MLLKCTNKWTVNKGIIALKSYLFASHFRANLVYISKLYMATVEIMDVATCKN